MSAATMLNRVTVWADDFKIFHRIVVPIVIFVVAVQCLSQLIPTTAFASTANLQDLSPKISDVLAVTGSAKPSLRYRETLLGAPTLRALGIPPVGPWHQFPAEQAMQILLHNSPIGDSTLVGAEWRRDVVAPRSEGHAALLAGLGVRRVSIVADLGHAGKQEHYV